MIAVYILAGYLAVSLVLLGAIAFIRRGCKREGPFVSPLGGPVWVIWNDPLATMLGGNDRAYTTILRTIGANRVATKVGFTFYFLGHECWHSHFQWRIWGLLSELLFLPAYVALIWLGHSSPLEVPAYSFGDMLRKLRPDHPKRIPWDALTIEVNATRPT